MPLQNIYLEGWPSGLRRTLGERVWGNSPWVRIPLLPPIFNFGVFEGSCLALAEFIRQIGGLGLGKSNDFIRIFEIQKQFLPAQTEVQTNLF